MYSNFQTSEFVFRNSSTNEATIKSLMSRDFLKISRFLLTLFVILVSAMMIVSCGKDDGDTGGGGGNGGGGNGDGDDTSVSAPTGVEASQSGSTITVSWNSVSNASNYEVYRSNSASGSYSEIGSSTSTQLTDYYPLDGYNYYKVKAINSEGTVSNFSNFASCNFIINSPQKAGNLTVTGLGAYTHDFTYVWAIDIDPMTLQDVKGATRRGVGYLQNGTSVTEWELTKPNVGTYTIVVSIGGFTYQEVYKFTGVTLTTGNTSVPFNLVAGSEIGTNGRLQ